MLPKGRDSRCSYRQLLQVDSRRDHLKSWPRLSFLSQEVFFLAFVWPAFTNLLPDRFLEAACSCSGALSAADGARDAGDSCVAGGASAVNSDAAVSAYDSWTWRWAGPHTSSHLPLSRGRCWRNDGTSFFLPDGGCMLADGCWTPLSFHDPGLLLSGLVTFPMLRWSGWLPLLGNGSICGFRRRRTSTPNSFLIRELLLFECQQLVDSLREVRKRQLMPPSDILQDHLALSVIRHYHESCPGALSHHMCPVPRQLRKVKDDALDVVTGCRNELVKTKLSWKPVGILRFCPKHVALP